MHIDILIVETSYRITSLDQSGIYQHQLVDAMKPGPHYPSVYDKIDNSFYDGEQIKMNQVDGLFILYWSILFVSLILFIFELLFAFLLGFYIIKFIEVII